MAHRNVRLRRIHASLCGLGDGCTVANRRPCDFADQGPLSKWADFGLDAPRAEGVQRRTGFRWYNFDAKSYLECGMAGSLGGWDEDAGVRVPVPGPSVPLKGNPDTDGERILPSLTWADLADIAINGQEYE